MHTIQDLKAGYQRFRSGAYAEKADQYSELGKGQDPDIMIISCADSRVEPAEIWLLPWRVGNAIPREFA